VTDGKVVHTTLDPFVMDGYRPVPTVDDVAAAAARIGAGWVPGGPLSLIGSRAESGNADASGAPQVEHAAPGEIVAVPPGESVASDGPWQVGTDLLRGTGSMEADETLADATVPVLWQHSDFVDVDPSAACTGSLGLRLRRGQLSVDDLVANPKSRAPVVAGESLTLSASIRSATADASVEVRWYDAMAGESVGTQTLPVEVRRSDEPGCSQVSLDLVVPPNVVAAQVYVRLVPGKNSTFNRDLAIDNVRLIRWLPAGASTVTGDVVRVLASAPSSGVDVPLG
jgi:hypothetical protein